MSTYVYAITPADHPLRLEGLHGVGEPAGELRVLKTDALGAVVSDAPENLRAKRRDLMAHQSVLSRLLDEGTALPMRFGLVGPDDSQVLAALDERRDEYGKRLKEIDGCVEYHVKVSRDEADMLREIVAESAEIRELNEVTRERPEAHTERLRLGELISREVRTRQDAVAESVVTHLAPVGLGHRVGSATASHFLNVSFLVKRDEAAAFARAVDEEVERQGAGYVVSLHGPLPPYSFV
ncbi:GvpL/GvpF family gas vesicle protein [Streptomyces sp. AC563]|uniref:GvpL/GvpF family gas vesicle protein n=1 Tax=Streptomyces buecherae TaxID=2763006 RepID=UPI00164D1813|nr:GvpL/GvpF family gas vesicle protein [Streptomyces buecherae]MBC3990344.1 GvpL/GvpF family gas vesicle protein [Streptomyces buecherae]